MPRTWQLSRRNVRGRGWHQRGYRDNGDVYFQLKCWDFSRECWENEKATLTELVKRMLDQVLSEEVPRPPTYLSYAFYYKGIILPSDDAMVRDRLDGGETVNVKVIDSTGHEWLHFNDDAGSPDDFDWEQRGAGWEPKLPRNRRRDQDDRTDPEWGAALRERYMEDNGLLRHEDEDE